MRWKNDKKEKLSRILRKEYFKSIAYPLIIIESALLVAYFWSNNFVNNVSQKALINETKVSLATISQHTASVINKEFEKTAVSAALLKTRHEEFFKDSRQSEPLSKGKYLLTADGVITNRKISADECTLFYSNVFKDDPFRMQKAIASEALDPFYNSVLKTSNNVVQVYFNSYDSMNRLCPFMEDALTQYPHDIKIPTYNFYYLADLKHNQDKKVVWTDAYLDPAGKGWMISAIAPVYHNRFLEGVVGIDITLEKIIDNILSVKLPYLTYAMIVDKEGNIIAMNYGLEPILGIKELTGYKYTKPVNETVAKPEDFNLLRDNHSSLTKKVAALFQNKSPLEEINDGLHNFIVTQNTIEQTGWRLILLVDQDSLLSNTNALKEKTDKVGYIILTLMALFYILFISLIIRKSRQFAGTILVPIRNLINATEALSNNLEKIKIESSGIIEIDILIDNFIKMGNELSELYHSMQNRIEEGIAQYTESQNILVHQSRLAAMGEMINMIAHQWRQPLSVISMMTSNILLDIQLGTFKEEEILENLNEIMQQTQELSQTIDDFRNFFKPDDTVTKIAVKMVMENVKSVMGKSFERGEVVFEYPSDCDIEIKTYPRKLMQVLINIVKNAVDAFEISESQIKTIRITAKEQEGRLILECCDSAGGIPTEVINRIFEPYFSTKNEKNGTGLGLYISKMIIEKHLKGSIHVVNQEKGACFTIELPLNLSMEQELPNE